MMLCKNIFKLILSLTVILFSGLSPAGNKHKITVETMEVKPQDSYYILKTYSGQVLSKQRSDLGFELNGLLTEILVDEGAFVTKGQPLARLDKQLLKTRISELKSLMNDLQVQLKLAKLKSERLQKLKINDHVSQQALDEALTSEYSLKEKMSAAHRRIDDVSIRLEKSVLKAPYSGQIVKRLVDEGSVIKSSQPVLQMLDNNNYEAHIGIPQRYEKKVKADQNISVLINDIPVKGIVRAVRYDLGPQTRTINVIISIHSEKKMAAKNLANITIPITIKQKGFWLPLSALKQNYRGLWSIYIIGTRDNKKTVKAKSLTVYYSNSRCIYGNADIEPNSRVIISGLHKVVPGLKVEAINKKIDVEKLCHE